MQMKKISVRAKDGASIPANLYAGEESLNGAVVVCHGFGEHAGSYRGLAERLAGAGYACVVFDQRGHGDLPAEKLGAVPGYQSFLDDVEAVAAETKRQTPDSPLVLYGHSMGGNIAANYLLRQAEAGFACAALESPWLGLYKKVGPFQSGMAKLLGRLRPDMPLPEKETRLPLAEITGDEEMQREMRLDPLYHNRMTMRMVAGINGGCAYALRNASKLKLPAFLAFARDDSIVSNQAIRQFLALCGPNVIPKEYASQHSVHNDASREEFFQDLIRFLDAHCRAAQPAGAQA